MTNAEMSNEFDLKYNNLSSNKAPGLDLYEKSVLLTEAQNILVKSYAEPLLNKLRKGIDDSALRQTNLAMLLRTVNGRALTSTNINVHNGNNVAYYQIPEDLLCYINEVLIVDRKHEDCNLMVIPLSYQEYLRNMSKPYKRPLKNQAWRLINSGTATAFKYTDYAAIAAILSNQTKQYTVDQALKLLKNRSLTILNDMLVSEDSYWSAIDAGFTKNPSLAMILTKTTQDSIESYLNVAVNSSSTVVEVIPGPNDTIKSYIIKYLAKPSPIILTDLTNEGVSIGGGYTQEQSCQLDSSMHQAIVQKAVELALASYGNRTTLQDQISLGQASATEQGIVTR